MKKCINCDNLVSRRNKFCNNACQREYETSTLINRWLSGESIIRKGGTSIPTWMRAFLLKEMNYQCSECKWGRVNLYTNTIPLDIDHIDGDAYNNKKENLRVLCPNCHSLKKTFKNTGNRKSSRIRRNSKNNFYTSVV